MNITLILLLHKHSFLNFSQLFLVENVFTVQFCIMSTGNNINKLFFIKANHILIKDKPKFEKKLLIFYFN